MSVALRIAHARYITTGGKRAQDGKGSVSQSAVGRFISLVTTDVDHRLEVLFHVGDVLIPSYLMQSSIMPFARDR